MPVDDSHGYQADTQVADLHKQPSQPVSCTPVESGLLIGAQRSRAPEELNLAEGHRAAGRPGHGKPVVLVAARAGDLERTAFFAATKR
jgi:hypothetical protein